MDEIRWWHTSFGSAEIQKISESINAEHISQGPVTEEFEARCAAALNVRFAVATTSGSVSLLMALMALGVGKGDEVIVPNRTFIAAAHAAMLLGAEIVLVDVTPDLPIMDMDQLRKKITPRTKAIIPVHLNGRSNDMDQINQIADEYGLAVVEDACQALFSRNASGYLGTQSNAGCFSLGVTKLISTGQGGVVVTDNEETYEKLKLIRNHGVYDTFEATYKHVGLNFKFTDLLSSIGLVQLSKIPERLAHMNAIHDRYDSAFDEFQFPFIKIIPVNVEAGEVPLWVEVLCEDRPKMMSYLRSKGIQTRRFLPDLDDSPHLKNYSEFPNSRMFGNHGVFMPCGPSQSLENIDRVIDALRKF